MKSLRRIEAKDRRAVRPLKSPEEINRVRFVLLDQPRNLLFFDLATQTGSGVKDLLKLRVKDLKYLELGERLPLTHKKAGTTYRPTMSKSIQRTLERYLEESGLSDDSLFFKSKKGDKALNLASVSDMIKRWFEAAGLPGLTGATTLRKTWEMHYQSGPGVEAQATVDQRVAQALKPLATATLQAAVYQELYQAIAGSKIVPGERLYVGQISRRMKVSQHLVRQALRQLEKIGFVHRSKNKVFRANDLGLAEIEEIIKIRIRVETMAAQEACRRRSKRTLQDLEKTHAQFCRFVDDPVKYQRYNYDFHHLIYRQAEMPILYRMIEALWTKMVPYQDLRMMGKKFLDPVTAMNCHQGMLEAMRRQEPEEMGRWLENDLNHFLKLAAKNLNSLKEA